jgi:hypothetical protein
VYLIPDIYTPIQGATYLHAYPGRDNPLIKMDAKSQAVTRKAMEKAATQTNTMLLRKVADQQKNGTWQFHEDPPILTHVDAKTRKSVIDALSEYANSLSRELSSPVRQRR